MLSQHLARNSGNDPLQFQKSAHASFVKVPKDQRFPFSANHRKGDFHRAVAGVGISHFHVTALQNSAFLLALSNALISSADQSNLMKIPFTGGCACGAIRYECTAEPIAMFKCHCRDCQKLTSGGFAPAVIEPAQAFRLTRAQLCYHFTPSISRGKHKRGFCPECGSRITGAESEAGRSLHVGLLAASLDDPSWFRPQMDIFVSDAQPWDQMDPAMSKIRAVSATTTKSIKLAKLTADCSQESACGWLKDKFGLSWHVVPRS